MKGHNTYRYILLAVVEERPLDELGEGGRQVW